MGRAVSHVHVVVFAVVPYPSLYPNAKRERRDPALLVSISVCPTAFVVVYPSNFFCVLACARDGSG